MPLVTGRRRGDPPLLLDLFCGGGGCSVGYRRAGFKVIGIDLKWTGNYPYRFFKADVRELRPQSLKKLFPNFAAIHASPPCKVHTVLKRWSGKYHEDLLPWTKELLVECEVPWVVENVPGAPLVDPLMLCGSMFGLRVRRHRLFELSGFFVPQPRCDHSVWKDKPYLVKKDYRPMSPLVPSGIVSVSGHGGHQTKKVWQEAMDIRWMNQAEMSQAIPPAYTEYVGKYLLKTVEVE